MGSRLIVYSLYLGLISKGPSGARGIRGIRGINELQHQRLVQLLHQQLQHQRLGSASH